MPAKKTNEQKMSFEQSVKRLDEIANKLESGEAPLDEALALYEEGARLIKSCGALLDGAEKRIRVLAEPETAESADE